MGGGWGKEFTLFFWYLKPQPYHISIILMVITYIIKMTLTNILNLRSYQTEIFL